ncbi:MAG: hypothetical protein IKA63_00505, partial [Clostridia bacterium]|nr:hypothetical protein [Clostridia bacterium]
GRILKRTGNWKSYHHAFTAPFHCPTCNTDFYGRVQARQRYEGVELKKRLLRKKEETVSDETVTELSNDG